MNITTMNTTTMNTTTTNTTHICDIDTFEFLSQQCKLYWFLLYAFEFFLLGFINGYGFYHFYCSRHRMRTVLPFQHWRDSLDDMANALDTDDDDDFDRADSLDELDYLYIQEELVDFGIVRAQSGLKRVPTITNDTNPPPKPQQPQTWTLNGIEQRLETALRRFRRQATEIERRLKQLRAKTGNGYASPRLSSEGSKHVDRVDKERGHTICSVPSQTPFSVEKDHHKVAIVAPSRTSKYRNTFEGKKECYVCMEECETRTDCKCKAPVHIECLARVRTLNKCTICQTGWLSLNKELALDALDNVHQVSDEMQIKKHYSYRKPARDGRGDVL